MKGTFLPEQKRALVYARKRGTDAPVSEICARVTGTYSELDALVAGVPADIAIEHRSTSGWCIQEVVDHLVESDRPAIHQLAQLLEGHDVDEPIAASLQSANPHETEWQTLLRQLRTVHENLLDVLARGTDHSPLTTTAAVQMVVKCEMPDGTLQSVSWVHRFDWKAYAILIHAHNREHIAQIHRILNAPASPMTSPS
jgi:hypothetical protein